MNKANVPSVETEVAGQLCVLQAMCRHFGWLIPAFYINAAREEILGSSADKREQTPRSA